MNKYAQLKAIFMLNLSLYCIFLVLLWTKNLISSEQQGSHL